MKDVSKFSDLHQSHSIEYERQRHLANWLIESSPHMPNVIGFDKAGGSKKKSTKQKQKQLSNPIIFLNRVSSATSSLSKAAGFNSQNNLPLQIVARDGNTAKIRRFNSHDTSANMFSVADFENARLARRNELENAFLMKQRNRYKMNSLSSGGDYSTGDSKGSKFSTESISDPVTVELFLEKFPLPRIVRLSYDENMCTDTIASFSSTESNENSKTKPGNGELFLLYRHLKDHKVYHAVSAKASSNRKRGIRIPQDFQGYFSLLNDKGQATATTYTTIVHLVRERVYKFLSVESLTAYSESPQTDNVFSKPHYVKGTAKAGQVFRLLAVFQDGAQDKTYSSQKDPINTSSTGREKERGRYAQLVGENRQIIYVSLSTKGKFYEIEHQTPALLQQYNRSNSGSFGRQKPVNPECVHKISNIITPDTELPLNLKYISGPTGHNTIPDIITVHRVSRENVLITCPIEEATSEEKGLLYMKKLHVTSNMKLQRCFLGFENEQRMFSNPNVQNMFKFCQFNADNFARMIEIEQLSAPVALLVTGGTQRLKGEGLKIRNPLHFLLKHDKNTSGHEKEDSIIFLSKNDLENMEPTTPIAVAATDESSFTSDKMKAFQPNKKRWFRNLKTKAHLYTHVNEAAKSGSIDRYQDMSKLIQERFGEGPSETSPPRPSSEIGYKNTMSDSNTIQKSFSLQDLENYKVSQTPDIVSDSSRMDISVDRATNKSFISEKLYHEFHVKTKQHSKSSSSLHQLLRRKDRKQPTVVEERYPFEIKFERHDFPAFEPNDRQDDCSLTVLDDLPYSSVRDSIIAVQTEQPDTPNSRGSENIYAEIFNEPPKVEVVKEERVVPNFHRICEINNSTRIRISLFNDDPNQTFTAKI